MERPEQNRRARAANENQLRGPALEHAYLDARAGNAEAKALVCVALLDLAIRYVRGHHLCRNWHTTQDIASTAVANAMTKSPWVPGRSRLTTWFYTIVTHAAFDIHKAAARFPQTLPGSPDVLAIGDSIISLDIGPILSDHKDTVHGLCCSLLTDAEGHVLAMKLQEGKSLAEIARATRIKPATVRDLWRSGRDIAVLVWCYLDGGLYADPTFGLTEQQLSQLFARPRLRKALAALRQRKGRVTIARRLVAERGWTLAEVADAWNLSVAAVDALLKGDGGGAPWSWCALCGTFDELSGEF